MSESTPISIVVSGATGRMGRAVALLASDDATFLLLGGIDRNASEDDNLYPTISSVAHAGDLLDQADVLIDFSAPALLADVLRARKTAGATSAVVIGTTGLSETEHALVREEAERAPVLVAANFSLGVNLLIELSERVARSLGRSWDVEIVEAHHRRKEDAPSGTALAIGEAVAAGLDEELGKVRVDGRSGRPGARPTGEIGFHSIRGGDVAGDHQVHFLSNLERVELTHRASDRAVFAAGALHAARWIHAREPGMYTMKQVLDLQ